MKNFPYYVTIQNPNSIPDSEMLPEKLKISPSGKASPGTSRYLVRTKALYLLFPIFELA